MWSALFLCQYESGTLVIRYNNEVLFPSGEFAVEESSSDSMASGLLLWQIIVIAVGSIVFLILIIIILAAVSDNVYRGQIDPFPTKEWPGPPDFLGKH